MPYPAKTSAAAILAAALDRLEAGGEGALAMRPLAADLGITPGSIYRYFPDRAALEAAIAAEGFRLLRVALEAAAAGLPPVEAVRGAALAYLTFARERPALYDLVMANRQPPPGGEHALWEFVVALIGRATGRPGDADAAVALWAFLHGFVQLERADIFGEQKPRGGFAVGLEGLLAGLASRSHPVP